MSCLHLVALEAGFFLCIAERFPILPEPVALLDAGRFEKPLCPKRLLTVFLRGTTDFVKDVLLVHDPLPMQV